MLTLPRVPSPVHSDPATCTCGDCPACDDRHAAALGQSFELAGWTDALSWPSWTDEVRFGLGPDPRDFDADPAADEDRSAWSLISGLEWEQRQGLLARTFQSGRTMGLAGVALAVPLAFASDLELAYAFTRGWQRGEAEAEVDQTLLLRDRLPLDESAWRR